MKSGKITATILACLIVASIATLPLAGVASGGEKIEWSEIFITGIQKNENHWKAEAYFNVTVPTLDIIAFKFNSTEDPPSMVAKLTLKSKDVDIFVKDFVNITQDNVNNNTWCIVYIAENLNVSANSSVLFKLSIKKNYPIYNDTIHSEEFVMSDELLSFMVGALVVTIDPTPSTSFTPFSGEQPITTQTENEQPEEDDLSTLIIAVVGIFALIIIADQTGKVNNGKK